MTPSDKLDDDTSWDALAPAAALRKALLLSKPE